MTRDEANEREEGAPRSGGTRSRLRAGVAGCAPSLPDLLSVALWVVAGMTMGRHLLAPGVHGRLGGVDVPATCAVVAVVACFVLRVRLLERPRDAAGAPSIVVLTASAAVLLVVEGALMAVVGRAALAMWALSAGGSLLGWLVGPMVQRRAVRSALEDVLRFTVAGLGFGGLVAAGLEVRGSRVDVGDLLGSPIAVGAMLAAASIGFGVSWGRTFERHVAANEERAWLLWILWPAAGAMGFTYLAREAYPLWVLLALIPASLATIMGHALFATQRPRAPRVGGEGSHAAAAFGLSSDEDHVPGTPPTGVLRDLVEVLPGATALVVAGVLAAGGLLG